jgi:hypothetical protein
MQVASRVPYLTIPGNREAETINGVHGSYFNITDSHGMFEACKRSDFHFPECQPGECGVLSMNMLPMPKPATVDGQILAMAWCEPLYPLYNCRTLGIN